MVCEWTGSYLYQPDTANKNDYDVVCDAIIDYVNIVIDGKTVPIEKISEEIIAYYESYMDDEASNFGKNAYFIGEPWSEEDLEIFTRENMIEYWS